MKIFLEAKYSFLNAATQDEGIMTKRIAVVDDELDILELVSHHLEKSGYSVAKFGDAVNFLAFLENEIPDLIILDLMLPDADGFEVCQYLKRSPKFEGIPLIMLTAKAEETDKIIGLELGADDYVTKPFSVKELTARIRAVLRRRAPADGAEKIDIGGILSIDVGRHDVFAEGKKINLTSTEFRILKLLASKRGWVFSRDQILDFLWGDEKAVVDRTVDVHIKHLRQKLGKASRFLINIRGVGYKLET